MLSAVIAKELAAIAIVPNGATMTVDIIWAPHMTTLSQPMGRAIFMAFTKHFLVGRKLPLSCVSSETGSGDSQGHAGDIYRPCRENQEKIEDYIQQAHQYVERRRGIHIAATSEHPARKHIQLKEWQRKYENHEIHRCIAADGLLPSEPPRERVADRKPGRHQYKTENQRYRYRLPQNASRICRILSPEKMRNHHVEPCSTGGRKASEKPRSRGNKTYGRRGFRAKASDHGSIDELHQYGRKLGDDGWNTQLDSQHQLLPERHPMTVLHHFQEPV